MSRTFVPADGDGSDTCRCGRQFDEHAEADVHGSLECPAADAWAEVWAVLVEECGAQPAGGSSWRQFVSYMAEDAGWWEFRFQGSLGYGGKFYRQHGSMTVDCYQEDYTPDRLAAIARANGRLEKMTVPA